MDPIGALAQQFRPTRRYETGHVTSNGHSAEKNDEALLVELEDCDLGTALANAEPRHLENLDSGVPCQVK